MARRSLIVAALVAVLVVPLARADGDPASDYLLSQTTFVPPDAGVPKSYADQLTAALAAAKARGYELRVALIATAYDLGSAPSLYRQPKVYARFLGTEVSFVYKGRLLVVMPNGLGFSHTGKLVPADQAVVDRLAPPGKNGTALASTATTAVIRLAARSGVIVATPPLGSSGSSETRDRIEILVGVVAILLLGGGASFFWRRRRTPA